MSSRARKSPSARPRDPATDADDLRRTITDLASLSELPAAWLGASLESIADSTAETLTGMLGLELVFIRGAGMRAGEHFAVARRKAGPVPPAKVELLARSLAPWLESDTNAAPPMVNPLGSGTLHTAFVRHGKLENNGVLFAGALRPDFPTERDRLILRVAANHMAVALQRTRAVGALKESEARFRNLADTAPIMIWTSGPDGSVDFHSEAWRRFTGQALEQSAGLGWLEVIHPADRATIEKAWQADNQSPRDTMAEYRLRRVDGDYRWVMDSASPRFDERGRFLGYIGTVVDITERRSAEEELQASQRRYRTVTELIPQLLWACDREGAPVYFNRRWYEYTGMADGETRIFPSVTHPDDLDRVLKAWAHAVRTGTTYEIEYRLRRHDGTYEWFLAQGVPLRDGNGDIVEWYGSCTNIDAQRRSRERLRRA